MNHPPVCYCTHNLDEHAGVGGRCDICDCFEFCERPVRLHWQDRKTKCAGLRGGYHEEDYWNDEDEYPADAEGELRLRNRREEERINRRALHDGAGGIDLRAAF